MLNWFQGGPDNYGNIWFGHGAITTLVLLYTVFITACIYAIYKDIHG